MRALIWRAAAVGFGLILAGCAAPSRQPSAAAVASVAGPDFNGVVLIQSSRAAAPLVRAFGNARFGPDQALRADSLFQIGSISKWLTSVAVLRLVDRGELQLDVPIGRWLPELAASGSSVSLRHLMSNTSGIPNDLSAAMKRDPAAVLQPLSMLEAARRFAGAAPAFAPGSRFDYVPTNWVIVGAILERVSAKPYAQVLADEVLRPAGTGATGVPLSGFASMPGAASAYGSTLPRTSKTSAHLDYVAASGTVYSSAADLARLADAVYESELLSPAARAELSGIVVAEQSYALGGRVRQMQLGGKTRPVAFESGVIGGYKSLLLHVPGEGKTVVILNNTDMPQSTQAEQGEALLRAMYD